jgi:ABC-type bacteriocin/lantibiotic exporter with double-glycine peptidase domain
MWGYEDYGSSYLAVTGCGPTCLAMAGYYLTGEESMNPLSVAQFAEENGYYAKGYGSSWTLISEGAGKLGLTATELPLVKKKITNALEAGNPVILAMGKGDFTDSGHYIVLTGVEAEGFRVNDPNSRKNSEQLWTYEQLEKQIRNIWAIGKQ